MMHNGPYQSNECILITIKIGEAPIDDLSFRKIVLVLCYSQCAKIGNTLIF